MLGRERGQWDEAQDFREEMEAHLAHRVDDLTAGGMGLEEARRQAESEFGDAERIRREVARIQARVRSRHRVADWLDGVRQDLVYALRQLRRSPGFASVAVGTLALGVGATVTILGVVRAVVLQPLPFHEPDRLVEMEMLTPNREAFSVSEPIFLEWQERLRTVGGLAAVRSRGATLRAPGSPTAIGRVLVNAGALSALGTEPELGREFLPEEDRPGSPAPAAMISSALWQARFNGETNVLGQMVDLDGTRHTVVGVFPEALSLVLGEAPVITPLAASAMDRGDHELRVVGRLASGVTLEEADVDLRRLAAWQSETFLEDRGWSARLFPLREAVVGSGTLQAGWVLLAAAGLLLLTACVNVSNLLLARATVRRTEIGVRAALGAGRRRIVRQLFTESGVLALLGGGGGVLLATLALPVVRSLGAGRIPRLDEAVVDPAVLGGALAATLLATLLFGAAPALTLRRARLLDAGARGSGGGGGGFRKGLVAFQIAASVVLLMGTGLLFRSLLNLSGTELGFEVEERLTMELTIPDEAYPWRERPALLEEVVEAVGAVPGVRATGATAVDPFSGLSLANFVARRDRMPERADLFTPVGWRPVTHGFFQAMGLEILAGRTFREGDVQEDDREAPVVIDARLAERLFADPGEAVGALLVWNNPAGTPLRVLGVVEAMRDVEIARDPDPMIYRSYDQIPWPAMTLVVRTEPGMTVPSGALRAAVREAAPGLPVPEVRALAENVRHALAEPRFNAAVLGSFGILGLILALVGLYGLTAFEVRQRFREIGIRLSLGARPEAIRRMILRERLVLGGVGVCGGLVAAWLLTGLLEGLLHGVSPLDPVTWGVVVTLLAVTLWAAAWIPSRQATRVDPREVLNGE